MKYMLLIHHGETPLSGTSEWGRLSEDEQQRVSVDYQVISSTLGVTPGVWMESPEMATTTGAGRSRVRAERSGKQKLPQARSSESTGNTPTGTGLTARYASARPSRRDRRR
jgi:hypothetical protein